MKTIHCILFALAALLLAGCRPGRVVTETRRIETDSSALWVLRDSLQQQGSEIASLRSDLKRVREENIQLLNEELRYEIQYDTAAPVDTATGKPPVMSERFTAHNSRQEIMVSGVEWQQKEWSLERESLIHANSSLQHSVDKLTRENRVLKEKTTLPSPFNLKLLAAGIIAGVLLAVWLMRRRCLSPR